MENLEAAVGFYLSKPTDYAILINGPWGAGKTHYFKKHLQPLIEATKLADASSEHFKPILISLYGVKSIQEIRTQIFFELNPKLNKKPVKYGLGVLRILSKGLLKIDEVEVGDVFEDLAQKFGTAIGEGDLTRHFPLVICFDDVERRNKDLSLSEFFGYVNSLTQDLGAKVILIANEDKDDEGTKFKEVKEKVVGITLEFIPNLTDLITEVIDGKYSDSNNSLYKAYLLENISFFADYLVGKSLNIRILIFVLDYFLVIYTKVQSQFSENEQLMKTIYSTLLKFSLSISIEFREGKLSHKDIGKLKIYKFEELPSDFFSVKNLMNSVDVKNDEITYRDEFANKYYGGNRFSFFESIFNFITTSNPAFINLLTSEIQEKFNLEDSNDTPDHLKVYYALFNNPYNLTDVEYVKYTRALVTYLEKGAYDHLIMYFNGFVFVTRLENPMRFNEKILVNKIIKGINKAHSINYEQNIDITLSMNTSTNPLIIDELIPSILKKNSLLKDIEMNKILEELLVKFDIEDLSEFKSLITSKTSEWSYGYLKSFPVRKVLYSLKNRKASFVVDFINFIDSRYTNHSVATLGETVFLKDLLIGLSNMKLSDVRRPIIKRLIQTIEKYIPTET